MGDTQKVEEMGELEKREEMEETERHCHCGAGLSGKTKVRDEMEKKDLLNRLSRIEGQIRGIRGMVEKDVYCTDILTQTAAVTSALNSFNRKLLGNHIKSCVANDIREGKEDAVDELTALLQKLMK